MRVPMGRMARKSPTAKPPPIGWGFFRLRPATDASVERYLDAIGAQPRQQIIERIEYRTINMCDCARGHRVW